MKYLAVARGYNEPDNNTPSDEIMCKIIDCEPSKADERGNILTEELKKDFEYGVEVRLVALEELDDWAEVATIW